MKTPNFRLDGRRALVTGAGRGTGLAAAHALAQAGAVVTPAERTAADLERANRSVAYVGDSPNDAPMFAFFANSVGVANVGRFAGRMSDEPKFVTQASSGAGFAELIAHLLR